MKILFLDIDGVLNHEKFYERKQSDKDLFYIQYPLSEFDPICIEYLNEILDKTAAKLVISSSWRFNKNLQNILSEVGLKHQIFDITPYGLGKCRGYEIDMWLQNHSDVTNYVIIDDDSDMLKKQKKHFVRTSELNGLTEELKYKIIKILNDTD